MGPKHVCYLVLYFEQFVGLTTAVVLLFCCVASGLTYLAFVVRFIQSTSASNGLICVELASTFGIKFRNL